jgi:putative nucleotidyltransferase with HDIG domain
MTTTMMTSATLLEDFIERGQELANTGEFDQALELFESAFQLLATEGDAKQAARLFRRIAMIHRERGEAETATEAYETCLAIAEANDLRDEIAAAYNGLAIIEQHSGAPDKAESLYRDAKRIAVSIANESLIAMIDTNLGNLAGVRGDIPAALLSHTSSLFRYQRIGNQGAATRALTNMGKAHVELGELEAGASCFEQAYEIANSCRDIYSLGFIQLHRAELHLRRQHYEEARGCCDDGFTMFTHLDSKAGLGEAYKFYGALYRETGKPHLADIHLSLALTLSRDASNILLEAEVQHELARVHLEERRNLEAMTSLNRAHKLFNLSQARREVITIEKQMNELEGTYLKVVGRWGSEAIEAKDPYTLGHSERVSAYAVNLAKTVGITGRELTWLRIGGLLHDVGKTIVPTSVLVKPGVLNESEWTMMKRHTVVGDEIVASLDLPFNVRPIVRNHHERWDGQGYPDGLAGDEIPFEARVLAVADVWDALTTARSYRNAFPAGEARRILEHQAGRSLDPKLVQAFQDTLAMA